MPELPTSAVTFLFTDIEGSTRRWEAERDAMARALARHDALLCGAFEARGGQVFKTIGDAFQVAFHDPVAAILAAAEAQRALTAEDWSACGTDFPELRVRMALHIGPAAPEADGDYRTPLLNRVARLMSAGHGGQVLLTLALGETVRDHLPEDLILRDLGERRLKDLRRAERVFQVEAPGLPGDFPPLATLDARPNNLPVQLTSFVGREREMVEIKRLLGTAHLVTLTGVGGAGKTRLALQTAADLIDDFDHGVWFVDLAPITDPSLVAPTVATVLGVPEEPGRPMEATLVEALAARRALLVLDNCEQVVEACGRLAAALLRAAPGLRLLATSRRALELAGEQLWAVPPLAVPEPKQIAGAAELMAALPQYEAVRLFIERALAVRADFAVTNANAPAVAAICHRLDGIPLAIELAAARVKILGPEAILARLDRRLKLLTGGARDVPARQQTLAAAVAWSYDLLGPDERQLFRRLAVFAGGASLGSIEAVCDFDGGLALGALDGVDALVSASLLSPGEGAGGEPRFTMLETIREYASERLNESGRREALARAHAEHFTALVEEAERLRDEDYYHPPRPGGQPRLTDEWLARLDEETANVRAAVIWSAGTDGDAALHARLVAAAAYALDRTLHLAERSAWLERALADAEAASLATRAKILYAAACTIQGSGRLDIARPLFFEAIDACHAVGDLRGEAWALQDLGNCLLNQGDAQGARDLMAQGLALKRQIGNNADIAIALVGLGEAARFTDDYAEARRRFTEAIEITAPGIDEASLTSGAHLAVVNLASVALVLGDVDAAQEHLATLLSAWRAHLRSDASAGLAFQSTWIEYVWCQGLMVASGIALAQGDPRRTARLLSASEARLELLGRVFDITDRRDADRFAAGARAALGEAAFASAWAEGAALSQDLATAYALGENDPWGG